MVTRCLTVTSRHSPESLCAALAPAPRILLRSACLDRPDARYSLLAANAFLTVRSQGSRCEVRRPGLPVELRYGDPWRVIEALLERYELPDELDVPFPLGGAFGFWGYDLRRFVEPRLRSRHEAEPQTPDCWVAFHDSLVVWDHQTGSMQVLSTGMQADGSRDSARARRAEAWWLDRLGQEPLPEAEPGSPQEATGAADGLGDIRSSFTRAGFCQAVRAAQRYIRAGHIYQVNLSQALTTEAPRGAWALWRRLSAISPAPFSCYLDAGDFQLASVSPELFLRLSGRQIVTRPIKGTRPRSPDPAEDARLAYQLQTSTKEIAELVMITDLLRNDLGRVSEFGSVQVPDLMRLERFAEVHHLVSTVEGRLRPGITHLGALRACFPGGSITGAPKIRAMEIIDELEPVPRGPYTGCAGYLGFNRESQLNILIRTALVCDGRATYHAGAGIVADSDPEAEFEETIAKARAFLSLCRRSPIPAQPPAT